MYLTVTYEDGSESNLPIEPGQVLQVYDSTKGVVAACATTGIDDIEFSTDRYEEPEPDKVPETAPEPAVDFRAELLERAKAVGVDPENKGVTALEQEIVEAERIAGLIASGVLKRNEHGELVPGDGPVAAETTEAEGDEGPSKEELYERAQELDIEGRSSMNKAELAAAIAEAEAA